MNEPDNAAHLELVSTEDLLTELQRRFDSMFFIGYQQTTNVRDDYRCASNAPIHEIYGLLKMAKKLAEANFED